MQKKIDRQVSSTRLPASTRTVTELPIRLGRDMGDGIALYMAVS